MRILQVNKFHYVKGGSERYYFDLQAELKARGHEVAVFSTQHPENEPTPWERFFVPEVDYHQRGSLAGLGKARKVLWNKDAADRLDRLLQEFRPDVAHLHNFHHQLTPSILDPLAKRGIPIVQTLHDYKWVCPAYLFLSHGEVCESCGPGRFRPVIEKSCHHDSWLRSLVVYWEASESWKRGDRFKIDRFLAPSRFLADRVIAHGLPADRVFHLPYFIREAEYRPADRPGRGFLYVGRLSHEKGLDVLFDAVAGSGLELRVAGAGPLEAELRARAAREKLAVTFLGYLSGATLHDAIRSSAAVIVPSRWYENQPYAILESMTLGVPVIGAAIGGIPELVQEEATGHLFPVANAEALRLAMKKLDSSPERSAEMGRTARQEIGRVFSRDGAIKRLESLYAEVRGSRKA